MKYLDLIDDVVGLDDIGDLSSLVDRLHQIKSEEIIELTAAIRDNLPPPTVNRSPYRFVGNAEMSALPYPCGGLECRSNALAEASLFAAMYADEVTLFNPFSYEDFLLNERDQFIIEVAFYISNLLYLHPLVERGIVSFSNFKSYRLCQSCFNKGISSLLDGDVGDSIYFRFIELFLKETETIYRGKSG
ncbi:hypothetical protein RFM26_23040 [Mesorhizobium sp. VK23B]|uniref:RES domain-containing protein n=1 Tax=Mesorhizobium dulcispinae TaxID=3072316 RepID=A0ABU4XJY9_9HYPH|nr:MULTISPECIES: hypothetical protein [unclassified Mesorhizobium]MDX8468584.1 hypothetical protein [Mesorhizobium sp. VK23B]MDX8475075.1 hypothetical protein [Mesorhizobium sp. VK23A]